MIARDHLLVICWISMLSSLIKKSTRVIKITRNQISWKYSIWKFTQTKHYFEKKLIVKYNFIFDKNREIKRP